MKYFNFAAVLALELAKQGANYHLLRKLAGFSAPTATHNALAHTRRVDLKNCICRELVVSDLAEMHFEASDYRRWQRRSRCCCVCFYWPDYYCKSLAGSKKTKRRLIRLWSQLERKICSLDKLAFPLVLLRKINPFWLHSVLINRPA